MKTTKTELANVGKTKFVNKGKVIRYIQLCAISFDIMHQSYPRALSSIIVLEQKAAFFS